MQRWTPCGRYHGRPVVPRYTATLVEVIGYQVEPLWQHYRTNDEAQGRNLDRPPELERAAPPITLPMTWSPDAKK